MQCRFWEIYSPGQIKSQNQISNSNNSKKSTKAFSHSHTHQTPNESFDDTTNFQGPFLIYTFPTYDYGLRDTMLGSLNHTTVFLMGHPNHLAIYGLGGIMLSKNQAKLRKIAVDDVRFRTLYVHGSAMLQTSNNSC